MMLGQNSLDMLGILFSLRVHKYPHFGGAKSRHHAMQVHHVSTAGMGRLDKAISQCPKSSVSMNSWFATQNPKELEDLQ